MWRPEEEIKADLNSGIPDRIIAGIQDLKEFMDNFMEFELSPLNINEILDPFGETVPQKIQLDLLRILTEYRSFVPTLSRQQIHADVAMLAVRSGDFDVAFEAAMVLKCNADPLKAVKDALSSVVRYRLNSPQEIKGAQYLTSCLLDGTPEVRRKTIQALLDFPNEPAYQEVIEYIMPQLVDEELKLLGKA